MFRSALRPTGHHDNDLTKFEKHKTWIRVDRARWHHLHCEAATVWVRGSRASPNFSLCIEFPHGRFVSAEQAKKVREMFAAGVMRPNFDNSSQIQALGVGIAPVILMCLTIPPAGRYVYTISNTVYHSCFAMLLYCRSTNAKHVADEGLRRKRLRV